MARYTKLRSGEWGLKVDGKASEGQTVTVTKKSGETKRETVGRVLWTGKDKYNGGSIMSLCTIAQRSSRRSRSGECECGACEDLLSFGYRFGQKIRCEECGGWAVAC